MEQQNSQNLLLSIKEIVGALIEPIHIELKGIRGDITEIRGDITEIRGDIVDIKSSHTELVEFLKDNMVTKDEFEQSKLEFDSKLGKFNHDIRDYVDRQIGNLRGDFVRARAL